MSAYTLWLIFGVACFLIETLVVSGLGFLFAGLGALTIASILVLYPELTELQQGVVFFAATGLWAVFLWKPIQRFMRKPTGEGFRNMVGDTAYIGAGGLQKGAVGEATWSGTIMRAQLAEGTDSMLPGASAVIVDVEGNTLIVKPKN
jgi:membrane protein implicated in regulation of membrane protease activity